MHLDVGIMAEDIESRVGAVAVDDDDLAGPGEGGQGALDVGGFVIGEDEGGNAVQLHRTSERLVRCYQLRMRYRPFTLSKFFQTMPLGRNASLTVSGFWLDTNDVLRQSEAFRPIAR